MQPENLPIWRTPLQWLLQVELSAKSVSRYHKYSLASELGQSALLYSRLLVRALNSEIRWLSQLRLPANTALI